MLKTSDTEKLRDIAAHNVEDALFEAELEGNLLSTMQSLSGSQGALDEQLSCLNQLKQPAADFYYSDFVRADDDKVRGNRMALCARLALITVG